MHTTEPSEAVLSVYEPVAYAHSKPDAERSAWHRLEEHLRGVAARAAAFAAPFGGAEAARIAGLWHDLGKYGTDFQQYLRSSAEASEADDPPPGERRVDHSSAGAVLAHNMFGSHGLPIAFAIACHHSGLRNLQDLKQRLQDGSPRLNAARASGLAEEIIAEGAPGTVFPPLPGRFMAGPGSKPHESLEQQARSLEAFTRMLFSALVDADFLDTEAFLDPEHARHRRASSEIAPLASQLEAYLAELRERTTDTLVNRTRQAILVDCLRAADTTPGLFSLTVPTGGGKTYAALAFALRHALRHGLERVIVVAPYTSIIDQTVMAYRAALDPYGDDVLEHHAAIDTSQWTKYRELAHRLATENWDAPIVVTTAVQFFESLFARRSSRCRKLHRIAGAVVILDEAQSIPVRFLAPILDALRELASNYGTSVVFSTATQPALSASLYPDHRYLGFQPLEKVREISSHVDESYRTLQRVQVTLPADLDAPTTWAEVARAINHEPQALAIVGRRDDARILAELVPESFHLSAAMCAAHRRDVLSEIRERLKAAPCRVVATQVLEAGVDIDFPVVYRALAGIDSLAQAAGRCNREAHLPSGTLHVFVPPSEPVRDLRHPYEVARVVLALAKRLDLQDPAIYSEYFRRLYTGVSCDAEGIQELRKGLRFEDVDDKFQMIDDGGASVIVQYRVRDGDERVSLLVEDLRRKGPTRQLDRKLQPFLVSVPQRAARQLVGKGSIVEIQGRLLLVDTFRYHPRFGLELDESLSIDPGALIA